MRSASYHGHVRISSVRSALRQTLQQTNKESPLAVLSTQAYLNLANTTSKLPAYPVYSTWPSATKMRRKSYAEADDSVFHDAPEAPKSNRACSTGAEDPLPMMNDEEPVEDPVKPGMGDTDRQIRTSYRSIAIHSNRANDCAVRDEEDAMDKSNVMKGQTRHAKPRHDYQEGADESLGLDYREE